MGNMEKNTEYFEDMKSFLHTIKKEKHKLFVVCRQSFLRMESGKNIERANLKPVYFHDFSPNPTYESVKAGVDRFRKNGCEAILAIGGGSAIDVAKAVKAFAAMKETANYLDQEISDNGIPLYAVPTTAGSGSEATKFAVIYYHGKKQSLTHPSLIPEKVLLEPSVLKSLPLYQRKATMMDALCHAVEAFWSVNSTQESREYSRDALAAVMKNRTAYLENTDDGNRGMLYAANMAGRAINIAQTTAAHAMSYQLTSRYHLLHGNAVAICLPYLWMFMLDHPERCSDARGQKYLAGIFSDIARALGCRTPREAACMLWTWIRELNLEIPVVPENEIKDLAVCVNPDRLKNNPAILKQTDIEIIYRQLFKEEGIDITTQICQKKLLILGGANAQTPAIIRAKELGYYVITCDYLPDNPGHRFSDKYVNISTIEKEKVLKLAEKENIQGIIAYASDPSAMTAAYVSDKMNLPGPSYSSVRLLSEKDLFREFQRKYGFYIPDFFSFDNLEQLQKEIENIKFPCMVKPVDSSGSKGITRVCRKEELLSALELALEYSRRKRVIVEEFIESPYHQLHGDGIVYNGKLIFLALGDQRFWHSVPIGSSLPSSIAEELMTEAKSEVARLIECSGYRMGGINVEVRITKDGKICIVEIGPRTGGNYIPQLMELATGEDEMTSVLKMAMGDFRRSDITPHISYCFQYIIGSYKKGKFKTIFVDDYIKPKLVKLYVHKKEGEYIDEYENSSGVAGVALLKFDGLEEMEKDIKNIREHITVLTEEV